MGLFVREKLGRFTLDELLDRLLKSYSVYYDVTPEEGGGDGMPAARCEFRLRQEKTPFPMSRTYLYAYDSFEYVYVFKVRELDADTVDRGVAVALEEGLSRISPSKEHRCSYVTAIFLCERATEEARKRLKKKRMHKDFNFSLHGWMDLQTALVEADGMRIGTNAAGRMSRKNLKAIYSQPKAG